MLILFASGIVICIVGIPFLIFLCTQIEEDDNEPENVRHFKDPTEAEENDKKQKYVDQITANEKEEKAKDDEVFDDNMDEISENARFHVLNTQNEKADHDEENPSSNNPTESYESSEAYSSSP